MLKTSSYYWIFSVVSFTLTLVLILTLFGDFDGSDYRYFFSSDTLYLPSVYQDLFIDGNTLAGWELNPAPNIFPDMIIYSLLMFLIGGKFLLASLLFAIIQYYFILFLIYKLVRFRFNKKETLINLGIGNLLLTLFFFNYLESGNLRLAFQVLSNSYHLGSFINTLLATYLILSYIKTKSIWKLIVFSLLIILASFSDKLFIANFTGSGLVIYLFTGVINKFRFPRVIHIIALISIISSIIGYSIYSFIPSGYLTFGTPYSSSATIESRILSFKNQWFHFYQIATETWSGFFIILLLLLSIIGLVVIFFKTKSQKNSSFWISSILLIYFGGLIFIPSITGSYIGLDCIRYNINLYLVALVILPFIGSYFSLNKLFTLISSSFIIGCIVLISYNFSSLKNITNYNSHYPEVIETLDELKREYNLKNGISEYWYAKFNTMFSKEDLRIYSTHFNLRAYYHVTNLNWFYTNSDGSAAVFNFVIAENEITVEEVKKVFENVEVISKNGLTICLTPDFIFNKDSQLPVLVSTMED